MIFIQSDGRFGFAAMATLVITAVMILSFSILSPLLEIAANTREMLKIANGQNREEPSRVPSRNPPRIQNSPNTLDKLKAFKPRNLDEDQIADNEIFEKLDKKHRGSSRKNINFNLDENLTL